MTSSFWKLLFVVCVVGSFSTLASYSYGVITPIHHELKISQSEQVGYSRKDRDGMAKLVEQATAKPSSAPSEGRYRLEIPFGCDDKGCLTAWAERPHPRKKKNS